MKQTKYYCDLCKEEIDMQKEVTYYGDFTLLREYMKEKNIYEAHKKCLQEISQAIDNILPEKKK